MKKMRKIIAVLGTLTMIMAMGIMTHAAGAATGTITITPPDKTEANTENTYKIYKVFDASGNGEAISYRVKKSKSGVPDMKAIYDADPDLSWDAATVEHFILDRAGNVHFGTERIVDGKVVITDSKATELSPQAIAAVTAYVTEEDLIDTVTTTGVAPGSSHELPNGYYYVTTTTGAAVSINSTNPNASIQDKNTVPEVDKKITGASSIDEDGKKALAQVGSEVAYTATLKIGKGAKGYVFFDKMTNGLSYIPTSLAITIGDVTVDQGNYTVGTGSETDDYTFKVSFKDDYTKTLAVGTEISIRYKAIITADAVTVNPEKNTAYLKYGDENSDNRTPVSETEVYNAKITVTKTDEADKPLAGAGFILKNAEGKYYQYTAATDNTSATVTWVDNIKEATEYTSDDQGNLNGVFTGLANGTYTLIENTTPAGYNTADNIEFSIKEHDYTAKNLEQTATVINQSGAVLPSTGGMGTRLFYLAGTVLVLGAGLLLITRKRLQRLQ